MNFRYFEGANKDYADCQRSYKKAILKKRLNIKGECAMLYNKEDHGMGCVALAFLAGSLLGAGIALLSAPQSGKDTRRLIKGIVKETIEEPEAYIEELKCRISSIVDEAGNYIEGLKSKLKPAE